MGNNQMKKYVAKALSVCMVLSATILPVDASLAKAKPVLSKKSISIQAGKSAKLTVKNAKSYTVSWKSTKKNVATVKKSGKLGAKVTAKKAGKATIKATVKKGASKKTLSCKVSVTAKKSNSASNTAKPADKPTTQPNKATTQPTGTNKPTAVPSPTPVPPDYIHMKFSDDMLMGKKSVSDIKYNEDGSVDVTINNSEEDGGVAFYLKEDHSNVDLGAYRTIFVTRVGTSSVSASLKKYTKADMSSGEEMESFGVKKTESESEYKAGTGEVCAIGVTVPSMSRAETVITIKAITLKRDLRDSKKALELDSLAKLSEQYGFKFGSCFSYSTMKDEPFKDIIKHHFNSMAAANEMKAYSLLNKQLSQKNGDETRAGVSFERADEMLDFAKANGIQVRGHALVWYASMVDWFFRVGYDENNEYATAEVCRARLKNYIDDVLKHFGEKYPDQIYCWDCVNEAVDESGKATDPRAVRKDPLFYNIVGKDYVEYAFKCADESLKALGMRDKIKLYYNDFNAYMSPKNTCIAELVKSINKDEKLCDGVGIQGYVGGYGKQEGCMNSADLDRLFSSLKMYADLGVEVQITEMAIRNYQNDAATLKNHAEFYKKFMKQLIQFNKTAGYEGKFKALSIWGICDNPTLPITDYSYKQNGPYCGLFDEDYTPKDSMLKVIEALKGE